MPIYEIACQDCCQVNEVIVVSSERTDSLPELRQRAYRKADVRNQPFNRPFRSAGTGSWRYDLLRRITVNSRMCRPGILLRQGRIKERQ